MSNFTSLKNRAGLACALVLASAALAPARVPTGSCTDAAHGLYTAYLYPSAGAFRTSFHRADGSGYWQRNVALPSGWSASGNAYAAADASGNLFVACSLSRPNGSSSSGYEFNFYILRVAAGGASSTTAQFAPASLTVGATMEGLVVGSNGSPYLLGAYSFGGSPGSVPPLDHFVLAKAAPALGSGSVVVTNPSPPQGYSATAFTADDLALDGSGNVAVAGSARGGSPGGSSTAQSLQRFDTNLYPIGGGYAVASPLPAGKAPGSACTLVYDPRGRFTCVSADYDTVSGAPSGFASQFASSDGSLRWGVDTGVASGGIADALVDDHGDVVSLGGFNSNTGGYYVYKISGDNGGGLWTRFVYLPNPAGQTSSLCQDASGDYLTAYPYRDGSGNTFCVAQRFAFLDGGIGAAYRFPGSSASQDYGYAVFSTGVANEFLAAGVGLYAGTNAYVPFWYRERTSNSSLVWGAYQP